MIELRMKDFEEIDIIPMQYTDDCELNVIWLDKEELIDCSHIPSIKFDNTKIYYLNKNNIDYISVIHSKNIAKSFIIHFAMNKGEIEINSIEISIKFTDKLKNYIVISNELFASAIKEELLEILNKLPFTEKEKEWYKNKVQQYIDEHIGTKMVSLSGGFKIDEDEMPVTETFAPQEQSLTLKGNKLNFPLEFRGKIYQTLKEICKDYDIKYSTVWGRINEQGHSLEKAIFEEITPRSKRRAKNKKNIGTYNSIGITYKGKYYHSISKLAEEYGIARATLCNRISKGWSIDRAVNEPPQPVGRNLSRKEI